MRTYKQLTQEQRYQLSILLKMGMNQTPIAKFIGVDKSTISRELNPNRGQRGYRPSEGIGYNCTNLLCLVSFIET